MPCCERGPKGATRTRAARAALINTGLQSGGSILSRFSGFYPRRKPLKRLQQFRRPAGVSTIQVQGRLLSQAELDSIRQLRQAHAEWSRQELSVHLAQQWQWRNEAGQLKDMATRTLLLKLQARGLIQLPPPRRPGGNRRRQGSVGAEVQPELALVDPARIDGALPSLRPLALALVQSQAQRWRVRWLLQQYHYRGFSGAVGETVQYLAHDAQGRELAVMVFGAAAWKVADRDRFIGWSARQRVARLQLIANQQRFLILPWVRVEHLASHLLALATRRLSVDWQQRYGHPLWLVESFVEVQRFAGTAYRAAGWIEVGQTTGRTRQDRQHTLQQPIKAVWVRPLHSRFREQLTAP